MEAAHQTSAPTARLLLVDDEENVLKSLVRVLRRTGLSIETAQGGEDALAALGRFEPQVVMSDYRMPGMDGVEFLSRVKERDPRVQRILLTGQVDTSAVEEAVNRSEIFRFVQKPWSDGELLLAVRSAVEQYELQAENETLHSLTRTVNEQLQRLNAELEDRVEERTRQLLDSEKMAAVGQLAGGVAHEINNPLGGILAFAQLMKRDAGRSQADLESLDLIEQSALRCKRIVESLLSFSRRGSDKDRRNVDLGECVQGAVQLFRAQLSRHKGVALEVNGAGAVLPVFADPVRVGQVLLNLLQNGLYAIGEQAGKLTVTVGCEGEDAFFRVQDTGSGIAGEHLPRLFEPSFTTKPPGAGTGLGLSIAYRIVRDHGGRFDVQSRPGEGARFTVFIPILPDGLRGKATNE